MTDQKMPSGIDRLGALNTDEGIVLQAGVPDGQVAVTQRSIVDIVENAAEEPKIVFQTATLLARILNDERVRIPHLLLALALTPRGIERLRHYGLNKEAIRRSCWSELVPADPPGDSSAGPTLSDNVGHILRIAEKKANDERTEHLSVDDVVEVITTTPLRERYQHYWNGVPPVDPIQQIFEAVCSVRDATGLASLNQQRLEKRLTTVKHVSQFTAIITSVAATFLVGVGVVVLVRAFLL